MSMEERYQRHFQLKEVGKKGQQKLSKAKVLVVGAGGLGCPALQYLTAAGIGTLGIMDPDVVSLSNLQRQILYNEKDLGKNKAKCAEKYLKALNNEIRFQSFPFALTHENALNYLSQFDIIVDGTDNFYSRYLISDACLLLQKVMVYGAVFKYEGQVSVFHYQNGPSYRCLFPSPPEVGEIPSCSEIGVLGIVPGIIGMYQALEVLKIVLELGEVFNGKLYCINLLNHQSRILDFKKNKQEIAKIKKQDRVFPIVNKDCSLDFEVSLAQLSSEEKIRWIDVREEGEMPRLSHLKPLTSAFALDSIKDSEEKVIAFCQTGQRSKAFIQKLKKEGIKNCFSLKEGAEQLQIWEKKQSSK